MSFCILSPNLYDTLKKENERRQQPLSDREIQMQSLISFYKPNGKNWAEYGGNAPLFMYYSAELRDPQQREQAPVEKQAEFNTLEKVSYPLMDMLPPGQTSGKVALRKNNGDTRHVSIFMQNTKLGERPLINVWNKTGFEGFSGGKTKLVNGQSMREIGYSDDIVGIALWKADLKQTWNNVLNFFGIDPSIDWTKVSLNDRIAPNQEDIVEKYRNNPNYQVKNADKDGLTPFDLNSSSTAPHISFSSSDKHFDIDMYKRMSAANFDKVQENTEVAKSIPQKVFEDLRQKIDNCEVKTTPQKNPFTHKGEPAKGFLETCMTDPKNYTEIFKGILKQRNFKPKMWSKSLRKKMFYLHTYDMPLDDGKQMKLRGLLIDLDDGVQIRNTTWDPQQKKWRYVSKSDTYIKTEAGHDGKSKEVEVPLARFKTYGDAAVLQEKEVVAGLRNKLKKQKLGKDVPSKPLIIFEGFGDVLSMEQASRSAFYTISLQGAGNNKYVLNPELLELLHKTNTPVIIALDQDTAGQENATKLYEQLTGAYSNDSLLNSGKKMSNPDSFNQKSGIYVYKIPGFLGGTGFDMNDMIKQDERAASAFAALHCHMVNIRMKGFNEPEKMQTMALTMPDTVYWSLPKADWTLDKLKRNANNVSLILGIEKNLQDVNKDSLADMKQQIRDIINSKDKPFAFYFDNDNQFHFYSLGGKDLDGTIPTNPSYNYRGAGDLLNLVNEAKDLQLKTIGWQYRHALSPSAVARALGTTENNIESIINTGTAFDIHKDENGANVLTINNDAPNAQNGREMIAQVSEIMRNVVENINNGKSFGVCPESIYKNPDHLMNMGQSAMLQYLGKFGTVEDIQAIADRFIAATMLQPQFLGKGQDAKDAVIVKNSIDAMDLCRATLGEVVGIPVSRTFTAEEKAAVSHRLLDARNIYLPVDRTSKENVKDFIDRIENVVLDAGKTPMPYEPLFKFSDKDDLVYGMLALQKFFKPGTPDKVKTDIINGRWTPSADDRLVSEKTAGKTAEKNTDQTKVGSANQNQKIKKEYIRRP